MYPPYSQEISERDRVLFKKFGSDLPPPHHHMNNPPVSSMSKPPSNDQAWQDLHFPVQKGGGMEDGLGGVMLAFSDSTEGNMSGSSRKKAKPDTGIAPWLSDAGDFVVSPIIHSRSSTAGVVLTVCLTLYRSRWLHPPPRRRRAHRNSATPPPLLICPHLLTPNHRPKPPLEALSTSSPVHVQATPPLFYLRQSTTGRVRARTRVQR
jgi:hypothetical protein